jgi:hypothetical protein
VQGIPLCAEALRGAIDGRASPFATHHVHIHHFTARQHCRLARRAWPDDTREVKTVSPALTIRSPVAAPVARTL